MAAEIATAKQFRVPLIVVVFDDARYGMVEIGHAALYDNQPRYPTDALDIAAVAAGMGATVVTIRDPDDFAAHDLVALREEGPVVVHLHIDPSVAIQDDSRNETMVTVFDQGVGS